MNFKTCSVLSAFFVLFVVVEGRVNILDITTKQVFDIAVTRNIRRPVIVYFTKPSCTFCTPAKEFLEDVARSNDNTLDLAIVDLEKRPELKEVLQVNAIPTTRVYNKGALLGQVKGPGLTSVQKLIENKLNL